MSGPDAPADGPRDAEGSRTAAEGTPFAVDVSRDRRNRVVIAVLLAGPVIWSVHFMLVYAAVEAGCTGDGPGLRLFDPPVATVVTLLATLVAALACLAAAWWEYRRWRPSDVGERSGEHEDSDPGGAMAFAGFLLSLLSFVSVLMVGLPALYLPAC